jgi:hypothetical protein
MSYPGLALDQAPPIGAPFRFFLSAPLFGMLAALVLLWLGPPVLQSRWTPGVLAVTHLLTLGVLAMVMFGALLQMLPVVAGAPVARPRLVATAVHLPLAAGVLLLAYGFTEQHALALQVAAACLAVAVAVLAASALHSLARAPRRHAALNGMTLAVLALLVAAALGLWLLAGHGWSAVLLRRGVLTDLHAGWALFGWVGMLVVGVAFQVVPMFQMTPEYPAWAKRGLNLAIAGALLAWSGALVWPALAPLRIPTLVLLALVNAAFALVTLDLQRRRKRRLPDVTLDFWRLGMVCLLSVVLAWLVGLGVPGLRASPAWELLLGVLWLLGFVLSVLNGMLYKIVPFLVWFHLQNRLVHSGLMAAGIRVPNMKQVIPVAAARRQFRCHLLTVSLLVPTLIWPWPFLYPLALLQAVSFALLAHNLWNSMRLYRREQRRLDAASWPSAQPGG